MTLEIVEAAIAADRPVLIWGAPGIGKTAAVTALAALDDVHIETLIGSQIDPVDVGGQPIANDGRVTIAAAPWAARIVKHLSEGRAAWLFLDELSCAPPSVQSALLRVVQERRAGECDLRGVRVIAAANPAEYAADGGVLAPATANRFVHVDYSVDASAWVAGELSGWGSPLSAASSSGAMAVCGWITKSPGALLAPPKDAEAGGRAWPSPRSWSAAGALLATMPRASAKSRRAAVAACVGDAAASEWATWTAAQDLPDAEDVLAGRAAVPNRGDLAATVLVAVAATALAAHKDRDARIRRAWLVLAQQRPDVALIAARTLATDDAVLPPEALDLGRRVLAARRDVA